MVLEVQSPAREITTEFVLPFLGFASMKHANECHSLSGLSEIRTV